MGVTGQRSAEDVRASNDADSAIIMVQQLVRLRELAESGVLYIGTVLIVASDVRGEMDADGRVTVSRVSRGGPGPDHCDQVIFRGPMSWRGASRSWTGAAHDRHRERRSIVITHRDGQARTACDFCFAVGPPVSPEGFLLLADGETAARANRTGWRRSVWPDDKPWALASAHACPEHVPDLDVNAVPTSPHSRRESAARAAERAAR